MDNHSFRLPKGLYRPKNTRLIWCRFSQAGKVYRRSTGQIDVAEAYKVFCRLRERPPIENDGGPLPELVERYMSTQGGLSKHYLKQLSPILNRFAQAFPDKEPGQITRTMIDAHLAGLEKVNDGTRAKYGFYIKKFFDWLISTNRIADTRHPAKELKFKKQKHSPRVNWVRKDALDQLIDGCADLELKYILYCGFHAGLRKEEVIMSRPDWFDFSIGQFGVLNVKLSAEWQPKDGSPRTIPLSGEFRRFLENYLPLIQAQGQYMVAPAKGLNGGLYRFEFRTKFENFVENYVKVGGHKFTFHDCRRSFASNLVSAGVSIYKVAEWLGDDVDVVQKSYGRLDPTDTDLARVFDQRATTTGKIVRFNREQIK